MAAPSLILVPSCDACPFLASTLPSCFPIETTMIGSRSTEHSEKNACSAYFQCPILLLTSVYHATMVFVFLDTSSRLALPAASIPASTHAYEVEQGGNMWQEMVGWILLNSQKRMQHML